MFRREILRIYVHVYTVAVPGFLCVSRFCRGCIIECTEDRASVGNAYIAVDWDPTALHLRYQTSQERVRHSHSLSLSLSLSLSGQIKSFGLK